MDWGKRRHCFVEISHLAMPGSPHVWSAALRRRKLNDTGVRDGYDQLASQFHNLSDYALQLQGPACLQVLQHGCLVMPHLLCFSKLAGNLAHQIVPLPESIKGNRASLTEAY
jgi:hypothetical protein